jgi:hypothetical protein
MSTSQESTRTLTSRTTACIELFEQLVEILKDPKLEEKLRITKCSILEQQHQFGLWACYADAIPSAKSDNPIDDSLRDATDLFDQFTILLKRLEKELTGSK